MRSLIWLVVMGLPLVAFRQEPPAQETYKLIPKYEVDKKVRVQMELNADLDVITATRHQDETTQTLLIRRLEEFAQEVTEVQDQRPAMLKVDCVRSVLDRQGTRVELPGSKSTALEGKNFILKRVQDSYQVENPSPDLDASATAGLGRWLNFSQILPADAKKVDDHWNVNPGSVVAMIENAVPINVTGEMVCKLVKVADGRAELSLSGNLKRDPQAKKDSQATLELTGSMLFDVNKGQILSVKLSGELKLTKPIVDDSEDKAEDLGRITLKSRKLELTVTFTPE